jgi:nucleoside-diphosphate-sugar epimerase
MKVFVTGATGFVGSAVVQELLGAGHHVTGLARSEAGAKSLAAAGAKVERGDLNDLESLRRGAAAADGTIHTAFIHDFSKFAENCEIDRRAIEALGETLAGSNRPLIVTSGMAVNARGPLATEDDAESPGLPRKSESAGFEAGKRGLRVIVVRLPQVHDTRKAGLITYLTALAREKRVSAFAGEGANRWAAVHVSDAARLYRLAIEKQEAGAKYHAIAEEGVPLRQIAEALGRGLKVPVVSKSPEEVAAHFGWMAAFVARDLTGSSAQTQRRLGWQPTGPGLITDLDNGDYSGN